MDLANRETRGPHGSSVLAPMPDSLFSAEANVAIRWARCVAALQITRFGAARVPTEATSLPPRSLSGVRVEKVPLTRESAAFRP